MASSGPNSAGTGANDSSYGTTAWSDPTRIVASDNSRARFLLAGTPPEVSQYLVASQFGFTVSGTIDGILVEIERRATASSFTSRDDRVRIVKGGVIGSTDKASASYYPSPTDAYASYGSSSDLWGDTWTDMDVNSSTFGVALASKIETDPGFGEAVGVDHVRITVYYTATAAGGLPSRPRRQSRSRSLITR